MKILVTGAKGFIGTHLCRALNEANHVVKEIDFDDGDLTAEGVADLWIDQFRPELVIHLAAQVGRLFGERSTRFTIDSNALMTGNVAISCAKFEVPLLYVSTSEIYGDQGDNWCAEDNPGVLPHNLYGLTKRWGEEIATLYAAPTGLQIVRLSMPFGPGLPAGVGRAAIINFLDQARSGKEIPVHNNASRCWCYVDDTVRGFLAVIHGEVAESPEQIRAGYGVYNVGRADNETSMREVALMACEIAGGDESQIRMIDAPNNQTVVKRLSMDKLYGLGWKPEVELYEGMKRTFEVMMDDA